MSQGMSGGVASEGPRIHEGVDATGWLDRLGVEETQLREAAERGLRHAFSCTHHEPPNLPGIIAWGKGIRYLRDGLVPKGWRVDNSRNYATVVSPNGAIAIGVAAGDAGTGRPDADVTTRSTKGPATRDAANKNQLSFADLMDWFPKPKLTPDNRTTTWLLLHYVDEKAEQIRLELSLPTELDSGGHVSDWRHRVILEPIPHIPEPIQEPSLPERPIDIDIPRRAQ